VSRSIEATGGALGLPWEGMSNWTVTEARAVEPTVGADCDSSYLLKLSRGDERASSMVEFTAPSTLTSIAFAREVLIPFLGADDPPRRLIVARDGTARVVPAV
jgi:hypothetical protein